MTATDQLTRLTLCLELLGGPQHHPWSEPIDAPDADLFVSDAEARHLQRGVDSRLSEMWGRA